MNIVTSRLFRLLVLSLVLSASSGCASMFAQNHSLVRFKSEPNDGTELYVAGKKAAVDGSPVSVPKKTKTLLISNPQYGDFVLPLNRRVNSGWIALDIFFTPGWGIVGLAVDGGTGKWYNQPSDVLINLAQANSQQTLNEKTSSVALKPATPEVAASMREGKAPKK